MLLQQEIRNLNHKIEKLEKENKSTKKNNYKGKFSDNGSLEVDNKSFDVESKLQVKKDDDINTEKDLTLLVSSFVRKKNNIKPVIERVKAVYLLTIYLLDSIRKIL